MQRMTTRWLRAFGAVLLVAAAVIADGAMRNDRALIADEHQFYYGGGSQGWECKDCCWIGQCCTAPVDCKPPIQPTG